MSTLTRNRFDRRALAPASECHVASRGPNWLILSVESPLPAFGLADRLWELANSQFVYRVVVRFENAGELSPSHELPQLAAELRSLCHRLQQHDGVLRLCGLEPELAASVLDDAGCPRLHNHATAYDAVWCGEIDETSPADAAPPRPR